LKVLPVILAFCFLSAATPRSMQGLFGLSFEGTPPEARRSEVRPAHAEPPTTQAEPRQEP